MNDNQILVVHSRWVYNFILFLKLVSDFGDSQTLCGWRARHRESTTCKWVCEMNRGIHCKSGHPFIPLCGSQSMQDLASLMRKGRTFLIPDANSCIDCEPHKGWPRFAMNASIHLSHTHLHVVLSLWTFFHHIGFENHQNLKFNFWKECIKAKKWKIPVPPKLYP